MPTELFPSELSTETRDEAPSTKEEAAGMIVQYYQWLSVAYIGDSQLFGGNEDLDEFLDEDVSTKTEHASMSATAKDYIFEQYWVHVQHLP